MLLAPRRTRLGSIGSSPSPPTKCMEQCWELMIFSLNMVDYSMSFLAGQVGGTILNLSYSLTLYVGPSCLKVMGRGGGGVVAHEILVSAQGPLVVGFWVFGFWD